MQLQSAGVDETNARATLRVGLLGGFRVERAGVAVPDFAWRRRSAKRLTKLLATRPSRALHREQVLETLWPDADLDSARNSLAKALHAARHALEPERLPREGSSYIHLRDDMITLDTDHVLIDAENFQRLAQSALRLATVSAYETALAAYTGVLLPEDLYEDWPSERRHYLADLNVRLLLGLAETLEKLGAHRGAVDRLRTALQEDPTREDVHRQLMRLYGAMGARGLALRQFEMCRDLLRAELNVVPDRQTTALYQELLANEVEQRTVVLEQAPGATGFAEALHLDGDPTTPFVGRESVLQLLNERLTRAEAGGGGLVVVTGEAGVGKSRLVAKFALDAQRRGACVLGDRGHTSSFPYGPFVAAVEGYVASRPAPERTDLVSRYPALGCLVPSVATPTPLTLMNDGPDAAYVRLGTEIARLLTEVAEEQPVVVVIGDLDEAHSSSLGLLQYLANLARRRRWLMIATLRDEAMVPGSDASRMLTLMAYEHLCVHVNLQRLERQECDHLVRTLLGDRAVESSFLDRVYSLTFGNPLFAEELVREVVERDATRTTELSSHDLSPDSFRVPAPVHALVEKAIAPLGSSVRRVLELAAIAGMGIALDDLHRAAERLQPPLSNVDLFDALDRVLSTGMLLEIRDEYTIRHTLVREVLLEHLPQHRKAQLSAALGYPAIERVPLMDPSTRASYRPRSPEPELR
jgi:DNA-binding SARP family transcriptional activator